MNNMITLENGIPDGQGQSVGRRADQPEAGRYGAHLGGGSRYLGSPCAHAVPADRAAHRPAVRTGRGNDLGSHAWLLPGTEFEVVSQSADAVTFRTRNSTDSLAVYPFRFALDITFSLEECHLQAAYGDEPFRSAYRPLNWAATMPTVPP